MIVIILRQRFDLKCSTRKPALHRPTVDPCMECYNAHAQDFLAPDELPLLIQKSIRTVRPSRRYLSVGSSQTVRTSRYICRCQKLQSSSQSMARSLPHCARHSDPLRGSSRGLLSLRECHNPIEGSIPQTLQASFQFVLRIT